MNGSDIRELSRHARDLAWELHQLAGGRPSSFLVLDALASAGLTLVKDDEGVASAALFTHPREMNGNAAA